MRIRWFFLVCLINFFTTIAQSQNNAIRINYVSLTNLSISYERYLKFNSTISIGYRRDYSSYDWWDVSKSYTYTKTADKVFFEYRFYILNSAAWGNGIFVGYNLSYGKNQLDYNGKRNKGSKSIISRSDTFSLGISLINSNKQMEFGVSLANNHQLNGNDTFRVSNGQRIRIRSDVNFFRPEIFIGCGFAF